ncbi:cation:proton antiporter [Massilia sp. W12]|uniref:cation:proton antiporter n=1 Tax=Massilia sp. W12 TaxID=3126507 RepID=UPI0030CD3320
MHASDFIHDLAMIMLIAGIVTVVFHYLRQPVVLGYIVAGVLIGPHTPLVQLIHDQHTIQILSELGVVFLMFSLGLEFSLRKLGKVGATAFVVALGKIVMMVWIGYQIGRLMSWSAMDALFLGAMLSISSTIIIVKSLDELGMKHERFAHLIYGILIVEDILAIGIIALLTGIAMNGTVDAGDVLATVGKLSLFMIVSLVLGLLIVPRLIDYVARFKSNETLLVAVLGLCFAFCLVVLKLDYSVALGAFMIGAVMAEARSLLLIERLIEPLRDMFCAIFFVSIGLLFDPKVVLEYALPITIITLVVVFGKIFSATLATFLAGQGGRTSMRVGMGLAPIGEFSFIIAGLGLSLKVTSSFLYPIVVAVAAITILLAPYLIKLSDPLLGVMEKALPQKVVDQSLGYTRWLRGLQLEDERAMIAMLFARIIVQVLVNCCLVATVFIASVYFMGVVEKMSLFVLKEEYLQRSFVWGGALLISAPFLIATYRKMQALSMMLQEVFHLPELSSAWRKRFRRFLFELLPLITIGWILLLITFISGKILPPPAWLLGVIALVTAISLIFWGFFERLHSRLQIALFEAMAEDKGEAH